jgi:Siderophore-interacting FAD-binding domain
MRRLTRQARPHQLHQRGYTLVDPDPAADTVDIEFALHDGVASRWAQEAQPGDTVEATVLGSNFALPQPAPAGYVIIGVRRRRPLRLGGVRQPDHPCDREGAPRGLQDPAQIHQGACLLGGLSRHSSRRSIGLRSISPPVSKTLCRPARRHSLSVRAQAKWFEAAAWAVPFGERTLQ